MDIAALFEWLKSYGLDLFQSVGIVCGLILTTYSIRLATNTHRVSCRLQIMLSHRNLWDRYSDNPLLSRILDTRADTEYTPISPVERRFVINLIQHVQFIYFARRDSLLQFPVGMIRDIKETFALPLVSHIWDEVKAYQDSEFVSFMEQLIADQGHRV